MCEEPVVRQSAKIVQVIADENQALKVGAG